MKKTLVITVVMLLTLSVFTGCEDLLKPNAGQVPNPPATDAPALNTAAPGNENGGSSAENPSVPSGEKANASDAKSPAPSVATANQSAFIGEAKAKEIALKKAGLSANEVVFVRVELDKDDGLWQYEIEFRQGAAEYEFDINATTGSILSYEKDLD